MTPPLFEKNRRDESWTPETLQQNLSERRIGDSEPCLSRKASFRKAWGSTAGNVFVKAKASVGALRSSRSHHQM